MQAEPQVVREGWLWKSPTRTHWKLWNSAWKKRYFVLCSGHLPGEYRLEWYNEERKRGPPKRCISLEECQQVETNLQYTRADKSVQYSWCFSIRVVKPKGSVLYYFCAESENDMDEWVRLLCSICGLHREDDSGTSGGSERFSSIAELSSSHVIHREHRNDAPVGHMFEPGVDRYTTPPNVSLFGSENGSTGSRGLPAPRFFSEEITQTTRPAVVRPPPAAMATQKPSLLSTVPTPQRNHQEPETKNDVNTSKGYISLRDCVSASPRPQPSGASVLGVDPLFSQPPPTYPPPPLPPDEIMSLELKQQSYPAAIHHSRSPSKDSSASSIHLSTDSEQNDRRPSGSSTLRMTDGRFFDERFPATSPTSPVSPTSLDSPAPAARSAKSLTDSARPSLDRTVPPPPRPPKTSRSSGLNQPQSPTAYENEALPQPDETAKFTSYDRLPGKPQPINFGSLPRTRLLSNGRRSHDASMTTAISPAATSDSQKSPSSFFSLPRRSNYSEKKAMSIDTYTATTVTAYSPTLNQPAYIGSFNQQSVSVSQSKDELYCNNNNNDGLRKSSDDQGTSALYSGLGVAREVSRFMDRTSTEADADLYQNFDRPPLLRAALPVQPERTIDKPPEVKRELKPKRARELSTTSTSSDGVGPLPNLPNRIPAETRKANVDGSENAGQTPFNIERRISFKSQKLAAMSSRQNTVPPAGGERIATKPYDSLDIDRQDYMQQLEYVDIAGGSAASTSNPLSAAAPATTRLLPNGASPPLSSSPLQSASAGSPPTVPGAQGAAYLIIDPNKTKAFELVAMGAADFRNTQQRTLERNRQPSNASIQPVVPSMIGRKK